ncbi:hypothetical protein GCM10028806_33810 [Spirosoma terrae]|uniref:Uncharacterized protein n=1 Tax=Spirosoma terrae TaxID=1968276 RepID=A0A6L9LA58_9BACT|nr:hypothetical protein [Spirosoma terrae]NDU95693.1 hypothetical protein [Spirosoma terrae]
MLSLETALTENVTYLRADLVGDRWTGLPVGDLQQAARQGQNVMLVDASVRKNILYPAFLLEELCGCTDAGQYPHMSLAHSDSDMNQLPPISNYDWELLSRFHGSWYTALYDYLHTDEFKQILRDISQLRKKETVFPDVHQMFAAFLMPLQKIKGVWMGPGPLNQPGLANGRLWAIDGGGRLWTKSSLYKSVEISLIQECIRKTANLSFNWELRGDLVNLTQQGVFLLQAGLTGNKSPLAHLSIWKPFTQQIVTILNNRPGLGWILFGSDAQSWHSAINPDHAVWTLSHPLQYVRQGISLDTDVFVQFAEQIGISYDD